MSNSGCVPEHLASDVERLVKLIGEMEVKPEIYTKGAATSSARPRRPDTMADLAALIERIEAATGADRELDALIHCMSEGHHFARYESAWGGDAYYFWLSADEEITPVYEPLCEPLVNVPEYTASIDASLALVEKVLPALDWDFDLKRGALEDGSSEYSFRLFPLLRTGQFGDGCHKTAPLAILAALLRSLEQKP